MDTDIKEKKRKYMIQKRNAEKRGIEFLLTFDEWWQLWEPHYHNRGTRKGQMCMCRTLDRGPYAVGNVRIDFVQSNGHERVSSRIDRRGTRWMRSQTPKGCGLHLPNFLMAEREEDVDEDPFVYYAELVTSRAHTKRD